MKVYQVVDVIEYEPDIVFGTFLKEESARKFIEKMKHCSECFHLSYLTEDATDEERIAIMKSHCPNYERGKYWWCKNSIEGYSESVRIKEINVIED